MMPIAVCDMVRNFGHPCPGAAMTAAKGLVALQDEPNPGGKFGSMAHRVEAR